MTHETQEQLRERKDEHTTDDKSHDSPSGDPAAQSGRHQPQASRDDLPSESTQEDGSYLALSIGNIHGTARRMTLEVTIRNSLAALRLMQLLDGTPVG
jgi:hypothetical protein